MVRDARAVGMEADGMKVTAKITSAQLRETAQYTLTQLNALQGTFAVLSEQLLPHTSEQQQASQGVHIIGTHKTEIANFCEMLVVLLEIDEDRERNK